MSVHFKAITLQEIATHLLSSLLSAFPAFVSRSATTTVALENGDSLLARSVIRSSKRTQPQQAPEHRPPLVHWHLFPSAHKFTLTKHLFVLECWQ